MTLVIDIGNTNIVCGVYKNEVLIWHSRFKTDRLRTSDEYYAMFKSLMGDVWHSDFVERIALASVVPEMTRLFQHMFQKYFSAKLFVVNGYSPLGLTFDVSDPGFIGADLIANAYAAFKLYKCNCIIVDLGTATTIQLLSSEGMFLGAVIAPGIRTGSSELFEKAAQLSEIELTCPTKTLGTNTKDAMLSGIVKGHALMIESFINEIKREYSVLNPFKVIATGGISDLISTLIPSLDVLNKTLTLDGLYLATLALDKSN